MDGFQVMPMQDAATVGDIFITVTGGTSAVGNEHFLAMHDGALVANSGHFNVELDLTALEDMAVKRRMVREYVEEFTLSDGRRINVLAEGRLVNLAAAEGHPSSVMDMSFANQALSVEYLAKNASDLPVGVHRVPENIDRGVAQLKLEAMGIGIDTLTNEQERYLSGWEAGT